MNKKFFIRTLVLVLALALIVTSFAGCKKEEKTTEPETTEGTGTESEEPAAIEGAKEIKFWHFRSGEPETFVKGFEAANPGYKVNLSIINDSDQGYQTKLLPLIRAGSADQVPDVISAESTFFRRLLEVENAFDDLGSDTYKEQDFPGLTSDMYKYVVDLGKDSKGTLKALSHQAAPAGLGYKRKLAKDLLGTDDPKEVGEMMSTPEKMLAVGDKVKGKAKLFPGSEDIFRIYAGAREKAWIVDNKLVIDPKINDLISFTKKIRDAGLDNKGRAWTAGWDKSIKDDETMFFAIPTWGVPYIIGTKDKEERTTSGGWAVTEAAFPYSWGGTWFGIYAKAKPENKVTAANFVKYIASGDLEQRAKEGGDFLNSVSLADKLAGDASVVSKVTNQNTYELWKPLAANVDGSLITEHDDTINNSFLELLEDYLNGKIKSEEDLIKKFKNKVKDDLSDITVE